ncbi:DUF885 domain-containing protein [Actinospica sp. MGRD01-02]|uniref:DUF885 domain-containing protein n=1 Tax=Actinospica acidithermotolerans TaxID=2828514 RepID=A0A941EAJ5_9ACTN|nr:DUF885 domain-containing protein [Actinospica acidithermotolerans]MBR7826867.1 DUF885 domain-containing protein [Actinospica acidithermotolerans]
MTTLNQIADEYVERSAELDPALATYAGIAGHDHELPDMTADGFAERDELNRSTLATVTALTPGNDAERVARLAMVERLGLAVEAHEAGDDTSALNVIASGIHEVRQVFDLMPTEGEEALGNLARRMAEVPRAYRELGQTLLEAARAGRPPSERQVVEVAKQCAGWTKPGSGIYSGLVGTLNASGALKGELDAAAQAAEQATAEIGEFLTRELLPLAVAEDAVGRERYSRASREFLGAAIDLDEAYAWGWDEVHRLAAEQKRVAGLIEPGASADEAMELLDNDPKRRVAGRENFRLWMQELADRTIADLHGTHFDIPEQARRIEACLAPTGDGGVYYTGPSEDWTRPGRMWWSVPDGIDEFSTWQEVTTVYHEGVPGHHLQISATIANSERLNRWQRLLCWVSGHGEGWALYSERLMEELGYLEDPGAHMGMLDGQMLRAARVVVDLGVHLKLTVPKGAGWREGETWDADLAWEFLRAHSRMEDANLRFELNRYLGWPGQAPSYKLGEKIWLEAREEAKARKGAAFSLKEFHDQALALGSLGLDPLQEVLRTL